MRRELPVQAAEFVRVGGARVAGAEDARPASQRINHQARIFGHSGQMRCCRVVSGFEQGVFRERLSRFFGFVDRPDVGNRLPVIRQSLEDKTDLAELSRICCREENGGHTGKCIPRALGLRPWACGLGPAAQGLTREYNSPLPTFLLLTEV